MPLLRPHSSKATDLSVGRDDPVLPAILEFQSPSSAVLAMPVPRSARRTTWIIAAMFASIVLAIGVIRADRVVTARGVVVSKSPVLLVQPLETSIVRSIDVHVGETVKAGQVLAQLNPTFAIADVDALAKQVSGLQAQVSRMQAETEGRGFTYGGLNPDLALQAAIYAQRQAEYNYKLQGYQERIDGLVAQIQRADADAAGYKARLAVATNLEKMRRELERLQVGSKVDTLAAMDNRAEMERNYNSTLETARSSAQDLRAIIAERDGYVQQWHADLADKLADAVGKLAEAQGQLRKAQVRRQLVELRADRDATVLTIAKASVGSVLQSGEQFITLMPADAPPEVAVNIPGNDAGYVHVGDPVAIKFDTFPFARYGLAYGTLRVISANSFNGQDQQAAAANPVPAPSGDTEPYYQARITFDRVDLHGVPADFRVTPGMPVTADVKVGKQTVLQFLLERIVPIAKDALREP